MSLAEALEMDSYDFSDWLIELIAFNKKLQNQIDKKHIRKING